MSHATRLMAGLILVLVPTIQFGGYFLLTSLIDRDSGYMANALRQNFFRAGHAHAGVITLLSLICQPFVDATRLSPAWRWFVRIGVPCRERSSRPASSSPSCRPPRPSRTEPSLSSTSARWAWPSAS